MGSRYGKLARLLCAAALLAVSEAASGQEADETPLALVLSTNGAVNGASSGPHLPRAGAALPLSARPGEIRFAGDALRSEGGSIIFRVRRIPNRRPRRTAMCSSNCGG